MAREIIEIIIRERGARIVSGALREVGVSARAAQAGVSLLRTGLGSLAGALSVRGLATTLDTYRRMENQFRILGYSSEQAAVGLGKVFAQAQNARAPMEALVNLYGKLGQAGKELGKTEAELLKFTGLTGKALAIQGTTTSAARAVLIQLTQAMGEGIVRAQEYNSMVENARPLLLAAAAGIDSTGGSIAKLRKLVISGKLTSKEFFEAVLRGGKLLEDQFAATLPTISQAMTRIHNAWLQYIGTSELAKAVMTQVVRAIMWLGDNFEMVADAAFAAGVAIATWWAGGIMSRAIANTIRLSIAQIMLTGGFTATNVASWILSKGINAVVGSMWRLTLAIAANPIGAIAVVITATAAALYAMRDSLVTVGAHTATVGNISKEVWSRVYKWGTEVWPKIKEAAYISFTSIMQQFIPFQESFGLLADAIKAHWRDAVNVFIGFFVGGYKGIVATWSLLPTVIGDIMAAVVNWFGRGIEAMVNGAIKGINKIIVGLNDFHTLIGADKAFEYFGLSGKINLIDVVDIPEWKRTANSATTAIGLQFVKSFQQAFSTDYVGKLFSAVAATKAEAIKLAEEITKAAAERDKIDAAKPKPPPFEFEKIGTGNGVGDDESNKKKRLGELQKAYLEIVKDTQGRLRALVTEHTALDLAMANGIVTQDQYIKRTQDLRLGLAEWYETTRGVEQAIHDTNVKILEMKVASGDGTMAEGFLLQLNAMSEGATNFASSVGTTFGDFFSSFADGFANSVGRAIVYAEDLGSALLDVARQAVSQLISSLIKLGIQWVVQQAVGTAIATAATAASVAQAAVVASAWAPAAAMVSLASYGANAIPANAALAGTVTLAETLAAAGTAFADGGRVSGPGGPRDDKVLASLSNGEHVIQTKYAEPNRPLLDAINSGRFGMKDIKEYADGGPAGASPTKLLTVDSSRREADAMRNQRQAAPAAQQRQEQVPVVIVPRTEADVHRAMATYAGRRLLVKIAQEEGII